MMMPTVFNDRILVSTIGDEPGYGYVIRGQLPQKGKRMIIGEVSYKKIGRAHV